MPDSVYRVDGTLDRDKDSRIGPVRTVCTVYSRTLDRKSSPARRNGTASRSPPWQSTGDWR